MSCVKIYIFFIFSFLFCFICNSCSSSHGTEELVTDEITLKELSNKKENEFSWTRELESVRLIVDVSKNPIVDKSIKLTPKNYVVATTEKKAKIYPYLEGFGNLDTTEINSDLMNNLKSFCNSVCSWNLSLEQIASENSFFMILFKNDVESNWKNYFKVEFEVPTQGNLFESFLIGTPFLEDSVIDFPVRFFCSFGYVDIRVSYLSENLSKINQLKILRWGIK